MLAVLRRRSNEVIPATTKDASVPRHHEGKKKPAAEPRAFSRNRSALFRAVALVRMTVVALVMVAVMFIVDVVGVLLRLVTALLAVLVRVLFVRFVHRRRVGVGLRGSGGFRSEAWGSEREHQCEQ